MENTDCNNLKCKDVTAAHLALVPAGFKLFRNPNNDNLLVGKSRTQLFICSVYNGRLHLTGSLRMPLNGTSYRCSEAEPFKL